MIKGRHLFYNDLRQNPGDPSFARRPCDSNLSSFIFFFNLNPVEIIQKSSNAEIIRVLQIFIKLQTVVRNRTVQRGTNQE